MSVQVVVPIFNYLAKSVPVGVILDDDGRGVPIAMPGVSKGADPTTKDDACARAAYCDANESFCLPEVVHSSLKALGILVCLRHMPLAGCIVISACNRKS